MTRWVFDFTVTPDDIRDMNEQYARQSLPRFYRAMDILYSLSLGCLAIAFIGFAISSVNQGRQADAAVQVAISAGSIAIAIWFHKHGGAAGHIGRQMKGLSAGRFVGPAQLEADERSVVMKAPTGIFELEWSRVNSVVATRDYVLLVYRGGKSVWAPTRAFPSPDERDRFLAFARQHAQEAHALEAVPSA